MVIIDGMSQFAATNFLNAINICANFHKIWKRSGLFDPNAVPHMYVNPMPSYVQQGDLTYLANL